MILEDCEASEESIIDGMRATTDVIAVEKQEKVVEERCAVHESRTTKDDYTTLSKKRRWWWSKVSSTNSVQRTCMDLATKDQDKLSITKDQGLSYPCHLSCNWLKAKPEDSWRPSKQGNHGVAETCLCYLFIYWSWYL